MPEVLDSISRPRSDPATGDVLGRWRLEECLGRGGMGIVFGARELESGHRAALKVLLEGQCERTEALGRFRREVQVLARIRHPGIVRILDEALDHDPPFFCMELLQGGTLAVRLAEAREVGLGGIPAAAFLALTRQLAEGLAAVHAERVLHRDIKPSNVLYGSDERARLADFGMAKPLDMTGLTQAHQVMGTLPYMAPETLRGREADARTDLYQLGVTLFEAAVNAKPFSGETLMRVAAGRPLPEPPKLVTLRPDLPAVADLMLGRLLAGEPTQRFRTASDLVEFIEANRQAGLVPGQAAGTVSSSWLQGLPVEPLQMEAEPVPRSTEGEQGPSRPAEDDRESGPPPPPGEGRGGGNSGGPSRPAHADPSGAMPSAEPRPPARRASSGVGSRPRSGSGAGNVDSLSSSGIRMRAQAAPSVKSGAKGLPPGASARTAGQPGWGRHVAMGLGAAFFAVAALAFWHHPEVRRALGQDPGRTTAKLADGSSKGLDRTTASVDSSAPSAPSTGRTTVSTQRDLLDSIAATLIAETRAGASVACHTAPGSPVTSFVAEVFLVDPVTLLVPRLQVHLTGQVAPVQAARPGFLQVVLDTTRDVAGNPTPLAVERGATDSDWSVAVDPGLLREGWNRFHLTLGLPQGRAVASVGLAYERSKEFTPAKAPVRLTEGPCPPTTSLEAIWTVYHNSRVYAALGQARALSRKFPGCSAAHLQYARVLLSTLHLREQFARGAAAVVVGNFWESEMVSIPISTFRVEARDIFNRANQLSPGWVQLWNLYADWVRSTGDMTVALRLSRRAVLFSPNDGEAWFQLASTEERLLPGGRDGLASGAGLEAAELALSHVERALARATKDAPWSDLATVLRGRLLVTLGRFDEANRVLVRAVEALPDEARRELQRLEKLSQVARGPRSTPFDTRSPGPLLGGSGTRISSGAGP